MNSTSCHLEQINKQSFKFSLLLYLRWGENVVVDGGRSMFKHFQKYSNMQRFHPRPYYSINPTFFKPFIDAKNKAIFDKSSAFPPRTASSWNPTGTRTIPKAVIANIIIGNAWFRLCRARPINRIQLQIIGYLFIWRCFLR